jgi:Putative beta-barrel porin-2, OmpL-like. bbp2
MRAFERNVRIFALVLLGILGVMAAPGHLRADDKGDGKNSGDTAAKPAAVKIDAPEPGLTERERRLLDRVEQLEKRVAELETKSHPAVGPATEAATPTVEAAAADPAPVPASSPSAASAVAPAAAPSAGANAISNERVVAAVAAVGPQTTEKGKSGAAKPQKAEPFTFADFTWLNGNARTKEVPLDTKFFTPEIRADVDYIYDFNRPKDDTIGGSSEVFRSKEVHVTQLGVGGDFHYDNVRARVMTQFGLYSQTTPRNDASPARGQWNLDNAYRYLSEAYGGYHFNVLHGINVDAGIFMSYIGLFSYYNFDNWAYQPSFVSSNTPWFFNGVRVQIFPTEHLKIEPWFTNGWQSYGRFNHRPGFGVQILYRPNGWFSVLGNQYAFGEETLGVPGRVRYHTDDSLEIKYYDKPDNFLSKAAFSLTGDMGCEHGGGVSCAGNSKKGPKQSFLGYMFYNRMWFDRDKYALTLGRREDQQSGEVPGAVAADQRSDGGVGHAILHGKSRRSVQGVGRFGDVRLHAEAIHHVPVGVRSPRGECAVLDRTGRHHATRRELRHAGLIRMLGRIYDLRRLAHEHVVPGSEKDREPDRPGDPGEILVARFQGQRRKAESPLLAKYAAWATAGLTEST